MKAAIDNITAAIVRPPRARYTKLDLGPIRIRTKGTEYAREDFEVYNDRGIVIRGSLWAVINPDKKLSDCCIIYLHPNSGSRIDVVRTRVMSVAAQSKCNVCGFDFSGCGDSGGEYVSLGVTEKEDLCAVMSHLLHRGCKKFVLWGRSMGAATAAMFYGAYRDLAKHVVVAMILDSPFTSFQGLAQEYSNGKMQIPRIMLSPAIHFLRRTVRKRCDFDILQVNPMAAAPLCKVPTIVLSGDADKIVPPALSEELYEALGGPKIRISFEGGHNSQRPPDVYDVVRDLASAAFRGIKSPEIIEITTEILRENTSESLRKASVDTHPSFAYGMKGDKEEGGSSPVDDNNAEDRAYKLAADAEAALKSLLSNKGGVEALTEADITQALSTEFSQRIDFENQISSSIQPFSSEKSNKKNINEEVKPSVGKKLHIYPNKSDNNNSSISKLSNSNMTIGTTDSSKIIGNVALETKDEYLTSPINRNSHLEEGFKAIRQHSDGDLNLRLHLPITTIDNHSTGDLTNTITTGTTSTVVPPTAPIQGNILKDNTNKNAIRSVSMHAIGDVKPTSKSTSKSSKSNSGNISIRSFVSDFGPDVTSPTGSLVTSTDEDMDTGTDARVGRSMSVTSTSSRKNSAATGATTASRKSSVTSTTSSWYGAALSLFSYVSIPTPLTTEEKAKRDICPRVSSAWVSLATALATSQVMDLVCDQTVDVLILLTLGIWERAPGKKFDAMSPEHRAFLLSVLAAQATAELGLGSISSEELLSWGGIMDTGNGMTGSADGDTRAMSGRRMEGSKGMTRSSSSIVLSSVAESDGIISSNTNISSKSVSDALPISKSSRRPSPIMSPMDYEEMSQINPKSPEKPKSPPKRIEAIYPTSTACLTSTRTSTSNVNASSVTNAMIRESSPLITSTTSHSKLLPSSDLQDTSSNINVSSSSSSSAKIERRHSRATRQSGGGSNVIVKHV